MRSSIDGSIRQLREPHSWRPRYGQAATSARSSTAVLCGGCQPHSSHPPYSAVAGTMIRSPGRIASGQIARDRSYRFPGSERCVCLGSLPRHRARFRTHRKGRPSDPVSSRNQARAVHKGISIASPGRGGIRFKYVQNVVASSKSAALRSARQTTCTLAGWWLGPCRNRPLSGSASGTGEVCDHRWA